MKNFQRLIFDMPRIIPSADKLSSFIINLNYEYYFMKIISKLTKIDYPYEGF